MTPLPDDPPPLNGTRPIAIGMQRTQVLLPADAQAPVFARHRAIELVDLLEPDLLASLIDRCRRGTFVADHVDQLGSREIETPQRVGLALNMVLSRPAFLRWIETATGHRALQRVEGRVVQGRANGVDGLDWHNDTDTEEAQDQVRRLGITISLSDRAYAGGGFELREVESSRMLTRYQHRMPGTALVFDVARDLEHRVLPLYAGGPRRVFTGWFLGTR